MTGSEMPAVPQSHSHVFLGEEHTHAERRTWAVIWLCGAMMTLEIIGGALFGSIALIADGLHMSTHAGAMLLAALAYRYARKHAADSRFTFGTGKLGDLAGFTSAIILGMIAVLIAYEAISRFFSPVPIHFAEAISIACLGLVVNAASAWLLSGGAHHRHPRHHHEHGLEHEHEGWEHGHHHVHDGAHRDNNLRAAIVHVMADAAISILVILGLALAGMFSWPWMDPLVGTVGAFVIASWSYGLIKDTGAILLDMNPDHNVTEGVRQAIEEGGDRLTDLHIWRLGPGHLGAIVSIETAGAREPQFYRDRLARFPSLSHLTIEVDRAA